MQAIVYDEEYSVSWPRTLPERVYIRYGLFSNRERSLNWSTREQERGISVYPAVLLPDLSVSLRDPSEVSELVDGRLAFAVTGRVVGEGSDGEPVLRSVRVLPYPIALGVNPQLYKGETK